MTLEEADHINISKKSSTLAYDNANLEVFKGINSNCEYSLKYDKFLLLGDSITHRSENQFLFNDYLLNEYHLVEEHQNNHSKYAHVIQTGEYRKEDFEQLCYSWASRLRYSYIRKMDVINRGFSGFNSRHFKYMIDEILKLEHDIPKLHDLGYAKICTLFLGTNDAATTGPESVPYEEYIPNMKYIISQLVERDIKTVIISPTHHYATHWDTLNPKDVAQNVFRSNETNTKFKDGLKEMMDAEFGEYITGESKRISFIDLFQSFTDYCIENNLKDPSDLFLDGIHFSAIGYKILNKEVDKSILENFPDLHYTNIKFKLPDYNGISYDKLKEVMTFR